MVNKVNVGNIQHIVLELFGENLVRGRGLLCRSLMKAQMASQTFTHVCVSSPSLPRVHIHSVLLHAPPCAHAHARHTHTHTHTHTSTSSGSPTTAQICSHNPPPPPPPPPNPPNPPL